MEKKVSDFHKDQKSNIDQNAVSLKDVFKDYFSIGTALNHYSLTHDSIETKLAKKHFNLIVAENCTKMDSIYKSETELDFSKANDFLTFGKCNNFQMRWHTLVCHSQTPDWLFKNNDGTAVSKEILEDRLKHYIRSVMNYCKGFQVSSFDVVNEVISDKTFVLRTKDDHSLWYDILGPDYIDKAFLWAHEADSKAELVINDYNLEIIPQKRQAMYELVKGMLEREIPVHAVGLQMHISIKNPPVEQIEETINLFGSLGVKVLVTEMDVSAYESEKEARKEYTAELLEEQAQRYSELFECFKRCAKKGYLEKVILWGVTDSTSWKNFFPVPDRTDIPLLFNADGSAKPAFTRIIK
ncbi:MAG: endo-1,4-beta-xylanase [Treponema sp.]|nr:endo-1,4-beta-xylanase [Treponema sp.]